MGRREAVRACLCEVSDCAWLDVKRVTTVSEFGIVRVRRSVKTPGQNVCWGATRCGSVNDQIFFQIRLKLKGDLRL